MKTEHTLFTKAPEGDANLRTASA